MINLLDKPTKKEYRAARRNATWFRYVLLMSAVFVAVNIILVATFFYLENQKSIINKQITENTDRRKLQYGNTENQIKSIKSDLSIAKVILDNEMKFTKPIVAISRSIPGNCILETLSLTKQSIDAQANYNFRCKTTSAYPSYEDTILHLKTALEKSDQVFTSVNIVNSKRDGNEKSGIYIDYPFQIVMSAKLCKTPSTYNIPLIEPDPAKNIKGNTTCEAKN